MPLLQESQPGRELVSSSRGNKMKCEDSDQLSLSTSNPTVPFPSLHHLTPAQLLASQTAALMAAGLPVSLHATLSSNPALFHHSLLQAAATAWNAGAATTPALSPTLKARKHNNNNNVVSSSSGDTAIKSLAKRAKQTRITSKQTNVDNKQQSISPSPGDNKETTWFSPPASASSPAIGEKEKQTAWLSPSSTDSKMITERSWFSSPPSGSSPPSSTENKETTAIHSWFSSGSSPPSVDSNVTKEPTGRDKQFTCGVCNRSFGYKHVLQNHERTHTGEKPFECPQCRKRFTRDHHLKTHMRLHTGERPYHCDHCDRQFVQVANLRRHLRVHTGERPYSCEQCGSRFSDSNQLKAHVLIHKGEKPYVCEKCNGRFRRRHHLMHHKCIASPVPLLQASPPPACMTIKEEELEEDVGTKIHERKSKDVRRVMRMPSVAPIITLPLRVALPEQTEPEDLSMSTGHHNVHSHSHSSGDSPLSRSPSSDNRDEDEEDLDEAATLFLKHEVRRLPSLS